MHFICSDNAAPQYLLIFLLLGHSPLGDILPGLHDGDNLGHHMSHYFAVENIMMLNFYNALFIIYRIIFDASVISMKSLL